MVIYRQNSNNCKPRAQRRPGMKAITRPRRQLATLSTNKLLREEQLCTEIYEQARIDLGARAGGPGPSVRAVTFIVHMAFTRAPVKHPLNESHPAWTVFSKYSDWFRGLIVRKLNVSRSTPWDEIFVLTALDKTKNPNEYYRACAVTDLLHLHHRDARRMLHGLEFVVQEVLKGPRRRRKRA
jgi:hypothetical protein